jgi:hypothetical protein
VMAPLNAAAILVLGRVALWRGANPWLRLTASATLVQQAVGIFYATAGRYYYLTWLLTLLAVAAWLNGEGLELIRQRWPALSGRIAGHPASVALARMLERMVRLIDPANACAAAAPASATSESR